MRQHRRNGGIRAGRGPRRRGSLCPHCEAIEDRTLLSAFVWDPPKPIIPPAFGGQGTAPWSDANNWSPHGVPGAGDDVTIPERTNWGGATFGGGTVYSPEPYARGGIDVNSVTISGNGLFLEGGASTIANGVSLTASGTTDGSLAVDAGSLAVGGTSRIDSGAGLLLQDGASLRILAGASMAAQGSGSIEALGSDGSIENDGDLILSGDDTAEWLLPSSFLQSSTGTTEVTSGAIGFDGGGSIAGALTIDSGATLSLGGTFDLDSSSTFAGDGTLILGDIVDLGRGDATISCGLIVEGTLDVPGSLAASGDLALQECTITGGGSIASTGTLEIQDSYPGATLYGTTLTSSGTATLSDAGLLLDDGATFDNEGTLTVPSGDYGFIDGDFVQSAGETDVFGALNLSGTATISGSISLGSASGSSLQFYPGGRFALDGNSSVTGAGDVVVSGAVTDSGSFDISGTTSILNGGSLAFDGGLNNGSGQVSNEGTLSLVPSGLAINGTFSQAKTGTLNLGLGGYAPFVQYARIVASGNVAAAGALNVVLLNSFTPRLGDSFEMIVAPSVTGTFDPINGTSLADGDRLHPGWDGGDFWLDDGFVVQNTKDGGHGSLRYVLGLVNNDPISFGADAITFSDATRGPDPISLQSGLPALARDQVTLTGLSTTTISGPDSGTALTIAGDGDAVASLKIEFAGSLGGGVGLAITGDDDAVTAAAIELGDVGLVISEGASGNTIGGAAADAVVIGSNQGDGLRILGDDNLVASSRIGGPATGNGGNGIVIGGGASGNTIGGAAALAVDVAFNMGDGILIEGDGTSSNLVGEDFIGTGPFGTGGEGNLGDGVLIEGGASGNSIVGSVCSGNGRAGIEVSGEGTSGNLIRQDRVGTDVSDSAAIANLLGGIFLDQGASGNTVAANEATGNLDGPGISISGAGTDGNLVIGNFVGITFEGGTKFGNASGVVVDRGASDNTIGGAADGAANAIAANAGAGVTVGSGASDPSAGNPIEEDSIYGNGGKGIVINAALQAAPIVTGAVTLGPQTTITGTVTGAPNGTERIELFSNPAGTGQGKTFLGSVEVALGADGSGAFRLATASAIGQGLNITATATDAGGDTTEFSAPVAVQSNVTGQLSVKAGGLVFNRTTRRFSQTLTITNVGGAAIVGPIELVLQGLKGGTLVNASGTSRGGPYLTILASGSLGVGQGLTITLTFADPTLAAIAYTPEFLAGPMPAFD